MKPLLLLFVMASCVAAGDRKPVMVTVRPVFVATVTEAHCVTIDGVDWDLDKIRAEYRTPWSWPGMTEQSLRLHLTSEHRVVGLERLSFDDVRRIHSVIHERERVTIKVKSPTIRADPARVSQCPGGVCPAPGGVRQGWLFQWQSRTRKR